MIRNISWTIVALILITLLPLTNLFTPGLPVTHDGQDHVARIANFYQSLREGIWIPRWASNLNWGYGHPVLMFLYPLPSYMASFFHTIGLSLVDSTKAVFGFSYLASAIGMYVWVSYVLNKKSALVAGILYVFAPYRFVDMYVRGALGEHVAFIFPPIICYGLARLAKKGTFDPVAFWCLTLGTAMLILAHNALSILFFPLLLIYGVYLLFETKEPVRVLLWSFTGICLGAGLVAFYWIPGFFEGKYTLRDIVTQREFASRFVPWYAFFYSPWNYGGGQDLTKWIGAGSLASFILSLYVLEKPTVYQRLILSLLLIIFFCLLLMTRLSLPIWETITLLQKFQFPWRLLSVVTFLFAYFGALVVVAWPKKQQVWVVLGISLISVLTTVHMWRPIKYGQYNEQFFYNIYRSTTDTGESSPIWSVRFMEKQPTARAMLFPDFGTIAELKRTTITREYKVKIDQPVRFVENTLYFPGWRVWLNNEEVASDRLQFQDPAFRGLMTFDIKPGLHTVRFEFRNTKLRTVAEIISSISLLLTVLTAGTMGIIWTKKIRKV